jgi:hypothetical protein
LYDAIEAFLKQEPQELSRMDDDYAQLAAILGVPWEDADGQIA